MADQRYATSLYNDIALSAPAFEIRWRSGDVNGQFTHPPPPTTIPTSTSESATSRSTGETESSSAPPTPSEAENKTTGDMPAGKIAGIVVGAAAAICAVLAAVRVIGHGDAAELDPGANPIAELQSEGPVKELDSNRPKQYNDHAAINVEPVELPGDSRLGSLSGVAERDWTY
ncbi:hypothetical protein LMH87_005329 [Akanthomyces muscarius]|uniref:Uncharacterized protein n=1 Tax=Akanthomyces muscarius TaxID=2231603 RepID=A0A9W8UP64_AKAMU|nr:hypothetical protein LMH87_005329 [Akanthomyces muscarius]KAJ4163612.1 hypothetical protein LMH87_005329 [Akanthomyces muscarius]